MKTIFSILVFCFFTVTGALADKDGLDCENADLLYKPLASLVLAHTTGKLQEKLCNKIKKSAKKLRKGDAAKAIVKLEKIISLSQGTADIIIPEANRLIGAIGINLNLPPDPGEAGKATLLGIDSDNDGVRDDIQRYIAITAYPDSARIRGWLTMKAKRFQAILRDAEDKALSIQHLKEGMDISACQDYIVWKSNIDHYPLYDVSRALQAEFMNTDLRLRTYYRMHRHISGNYKSSRLPVSEKKSLCDFDPDLLPN